MLSRLRQLAANWEAQAQGSLAHVDRLKEMLEEASAWGGAGHEGAAAGSGGTHAGAEAAQAGSSGELGAQGQAVVAGQAAGVCALLPACRRRSTWLAC